MGATLYIEKELGITISGQDLVWLGERVPEVAVKVGNGFAYQRGPLLAFCRERYLVDIPEGWLPLKEILRKYNVNEITVWRWRKEGSVKTMKVLIGFKEVEYVKENSFIYRKGKYRANVNKRKREKRKQQGNVRLVTDWLNDT